MKPVSEQMMDLGMYQAWTLVGDRIWEHAEDRMWDHVEHQVGEQVRNQVLDQVSTQMFTVKSVQEQVWGQVQDRVRVWEDLEEEMDPEWYTVCDLIRGQVREQVEDQVWREANLRW